MATQAIDKGAATLSKDDMAKVLPKIKSPSDRKADDQNAPLNASAVDIEHVVATDPGNLGFGVKAETKKVDVEA